MDVFAARNDFACSLKHNERSFDMVDRASLALVVLLLSAVVASAADRTEERFLDGLAARNYLTQLAARTSAWRQRIVETKSEYAATGAIWYVSSAGSDANDGATPETAIASCARLDKLPVKAGDAVLFRRGDLFRGTITAREGVTYSAYGTGAKPVICGSRRNYARTELWQETGISNVWTCVEALSNVGLVTFDHNPGDPGELGRFDVQTGRLVHSRAGIESPRQLRKDLEFWSDLERNAFYLYSEKGNPGARFRQIEIACGGLGVTATDNVTVDNLHITHVGCHGVNVQGTVHNLEVRNCIFNWIGGSLLIPEGKSQGPLRFGNAVEVYGGCDGYRVRDCWIYQIYDTGITHQCHNLKASRIFQKNIEYARNLVEYCFWSIEYYNSYNGYAETENVYVHDNHCRMGGYGWGCVGRGGAPMFSIEDRPDKTINYVNEGNILEDSTGVLVMNFARHASPPDFIFRRNIYVQRRGAGFAYFGDRSPNATKFDESAPAVIRETFGETDGTFVVIPQ